MLFPWLVLLVAVSLAVGTEVTDPTSFTTDTAETPRYLCGRNLANARLLYCYQTEEAHKKKSVQRSLLDGLFPVDSEIWPWSRRYLEALNQQGSTLVSRRRKRTGIVDECCLKPCYVSELLNYC